MRLINGDRLLMKLKQHRLLFFKDCGDFSSLSEKDKSRVDEIDNCIAEVINTPTIDPEELRPKGEWSCDDEDGFNNFDWHCSECGGNIGYRCGNPLFSNYCPNCGAKMDEANDG